MPTLKLDAVNGSQIGQVNGRPRGVRGGWITDINTSAPPEAVMADALNTPGMPGYLSAYPDARYSRMLLMQHNVEAAGKNVARVQLVYQIPEGQNPNSGGAVFVLERTSSLVSIPSQLHPGTKEPFRVSWINPTDEASGEKFDTATIPILTPLTTVTASGFFHGEPPAAMIDAFGKVNQTTWRGKAKGHWLYSGQSDVTQDFGLSYAIKLQFTSKANDDWSDWSGMRDPNTGLWLPIDPADTAALKGNGYVYGIESKNGVIKVGNYDLDEFNSTFGF